jgi:hypothetical protein
MPHIEQDTFRDTSYCETHYLHISELQDMQDFGAA